MSILVCITVTKIEEEKFDFRFRSMINNNIKIDYDENSEKVEGFYSGENESIKLWETFCKEEKVETFFVKGTKPFVNEFISGFVQQFKIMIKFNRFQKTCFGLECNKSQQLDCNPQYLEPILMDPCLHEDFREFYNQF